MAFNIKDLHLADKVYAVIQCPYYSDEDKKSGLLNLFLIYPENLFDKIALFKYANTKDISFITDMMIEAFVLSEYKKHKEDSYSLFEGFYRIQAVILRFPDKGVVSIIQRVWGIDFEFYQRAMKNSVRYMIKNMWTNWDTQEDRFAVLTDYFVHYKKYYGHLSIWSDVEILFNCAFKSLKSDN